VRRVVVAAPRYLKQNPRILEPAISPSTRSSPWRTSQFLDLSAGAGSSVPRSVQLTPRLVINSIRGAIASAVGGRGVAMFYSYQVGRAGAERRARNRVGGCEPAALPVHVIYAAGRLSVPKSAPSWTLPCPGCEAISRAGQDWQSRRRHSFVTRKSVVRLTRIRSHPDWI
jgi:DNA-binding transcriptional LysR family regulator